MLMPTDPLARFRPTSLAELERVALLDRTDTKYLLSLSQLQEALDALRDDYRILEIDGRRAHAYRTLYFDTPEFDLFRAHHAGRAVRHKVRSRAYVDSGKAFLEVKSKNNKGRTVKHRLLTDGLVTELDPADAGFVESHAPLDGADLEPKLGNDFTRVTLVNTDQTERLTIDLGLSFRSEDENAQGVRLPGVAIAELKQSGIDRGSPFVRHMRGRRILPASVSKYCVGVSLLHPEVRHNAFKPTLRTIEKISHEETTHVW